MWAPYEGVDIGVEFSVVELVADPSRAFGKVWLGAKPRPPHPELQTGSQLDINQTFIWNSPDRTGNLRITRQAEAIDGRLVLRDIWQCEPTTGVFLNHEFLIDTEQHPKAALSALLGASPGTVPTTPLLSDLVQTNARFVPGGPRAEVSGMQISGLGGSTLTIRFNETLTLSVLSNSRRPNEVRLRFTSINNTEDSPFTSGAAVITAEWKPAATTAP